MSASVNKVIIIGNLGRDPELRYTRGDTAVCKLSVATTRQYTTRDGKSVDETEWHRVVVWGKAGENCNKFLCKGRQVYVEGRLKTSSYEDQSGAKRYSTEVVAETVQFLGGATPLRLEHPSKDRHDLDYAPEDPSDDIPF